MTHSPEHQQQGEGERGEAEGCVGGHLQVGNLGPQARLQRFGQGSTQALSLKQNRCGCKRLQLLQHKSSGAREEAGANRSRVWPGQVGRAGRRRPHLCCQVVRRHGAAHSHHIGQGLRQTGDDARLKDAKGVTQVAAGAAMLLPALKVEDLQAGRQVGRRVGVRVRQGEPRYT